MVTIHLYGILKEQFGDSFKFDVKSPKELIRACCFQLKKPHFKEAFVDMVKQYKFRLIRGKEYIGLEDLEFHFGKIKEFHLVPEIEGAGGGSVRGLGKIVLGVALVGAAFALTGGTLGAVAFSAFGTSITGTNIAYLGLGLALTGIATFFTPVQKNQGYENQTVDEKPSYLFNGAINVTGQGVAIPLVYGQMITGSVVISTGIETAQI